MARAGNPATSVSAVGSEESSPGNGLFRLLALTSPLIVLLCFSAAILDLQLGHETWQIWWMIGAVVGVAGMAAGLWTQRRAGRGTGVQRTRLLEQLLDLSRDGMVEVDEEGVIRYASAGAHRALGAPAGTLVGTPLTLPESGAPQVIVDLEATEEDDNRVVEIHPTEIVNAGNTVRVAVLRDVTPIVEGNQRVKNVIRGHERFLRGVSRDIRNPLTAIVGFSTLLAENTGLVMSDEVVEISSTIAEQAGAISALVDNLLVAAVADPRSLPVERVTVDLERVLASIDGALPVTFHSHRHIKVWGDKRRVEQIVRNLISNARTHGGDRVWVEMSGSGDQVRLAVCDDGPGLSADAPYRVFEPYGGHRFVGERETVGLGLHVARLLARRLGGELRYRREGTVTRFELTLANATEWTEEITSDPEVDRGRAEQ